MKSKFLFIIAAIAGMALAACSDDDAVPKHTIIDFSPKQAGYDAVITITGEYFSRVLEENTVTFNGIEATVIPASPPYTIFPPLSELWVIVPKNQQCSGAVRVTIGNKTVVSVGNFTYVPTGTVSTLIDGLTGTPASFGNIMDIAMDASGNIYVAQHAGHYIRKITPAGEITHFAGSGFIAGYAEGQGSAARFTNPTGIAVDASGNVYVADMYNHRIRKITPTGAVSTFAGSGAYGLADGDGATAQFYAPTGIAIDASDNVYVADYGNHRIRKITPAGIVSTIAGSGGTGQNNGGFADGTGITARFNYPYGVTVDALGNVYVADNGNHCIRKITPAGVVSTLAGSGIGGFADGTGAEAQFNLPIGITHDASGNLYVGDSGNNRIRRITPAGAVSTLAGSDRSGWVDGACATAQFSRPSGLLVDASGNIYVADFWNYRIRIIEQEN